MKIQIFGTGCANCKKLYANAKEAAKELGLNGEVEYVDDMEKIVEMGLMSVPVLAIDGQPVIAGYVPDKQTLKDLLKSGNPGSGGREGGCGCNCGGKCK